MSKGNLFGNTNDLAEKLKKAKEELDGNNRKNNQKVTPYTAPVENKKEKISPKLFLSGRADRKNHKYIARSLHLLSGINEEIKNYCRGVDVGILNYLIYEGLKSVKESKIQINIDISELEEKE